MKRKQIILYDLDDTLCDSRHRTVYNEDGTPNIEEWIKNSTPEKTHLDNLIYPMTKILMSTLAQWNCTNVCITSRELFQSDIDFFKKHNIYFDKYLHRGCVPKPYREIKSDELKDMLLEMYLYKNKDDPLYGFDDLERNLKVFEKYGFCTFNAKDINQSVLSADDIIEDLNAYLHLN